MKRSRSAQSESSNASVPSEITSTSLYWKASGVCYLRLVGLNLLESLPHVGVRVGRVLQLDLHQRQAVDEQDDVGPAGVVRAGDGELVDRQPPVARRIGPIDQPDQVTARLAGTPVTSSQWT